MDEEPSFTPGLFAFLRELAANNDRAWFAANKDRYEAEVKEPALAFVEDVAHRFPQSCPAFVADARPTGGSMFRIHRDTRFANDKTPYKTHVGLRFRHRDGRDVPAPVYYLHLEPGNVFVGAGCFHPDPALLRAIRDRMLTKPEAWTAAVGDPAFTERFRLGGSSLKRAPAGVPADHPLIEDLKRKDVAAFAQLTEADALAPGFLDVFDELCRTAAPFVRFLCDAARVPYEV